MTGGVAAEGPTQVFDKKRLEPHRIREFEFESMRTTRPVACKGDIGVDLNCQIAPAHG